MLWQTKPKRFSMERFLMLVPNLIIASNFKSVLLKWSSRIGTCKKNFPWQKHSSLFFQGDCDEDGKFGDISFSLLLKKSPN
jgi:hypothetical protein